eukprot:366260-Chlamydomonas_euryale.AAC.3
MAREAIAHAPITKVPRVQPKATCTWCNLAAGRDGRCARKLREVGRRGCSSRLAAMWVVRMFPSSPHTRYTLYTFTIAGELACKLVIATENVRSPPYRASLSQRRRRFCICCCRRSCGSRMTGGRVEARAPTLACPCSHQ